MSKDNNQDILSYLKKVGIAREKGGALYEADIFPSATVKAASIKMAGMINKVMEAKNVEAITVPLKDLPRLFGVNVLEAEKDGKPPKFKKYVRERLRARGIQVSYSSRYGLVDFIKIRQKKY